MSGPTVLRAERREVTVWLNMTGAPGFHQTTVADLRRFLDQLSEDGAHDETPVKFSTELNARLTATLPLPPEGAAQQDVRGVGPRSSTTNTREEVGK